MYKIKQYFNLTNFKYFIAFFLFLVPFMWLKPGEMDLGGDSNRLYFYDPIHYLFNFQLGGKMPEYIWYNTVSYFMIPFVLLLVILKFILQSSYLVITILNGVYLVTAYLLVYFIVIEIIPKKSKINAAAIRLAALVAGLYYVLSPITTENGWTKAFTVHGDFFLNPLFFLLFLKFIKTNRLFYLLLFLPVSFFFAQNFSPSPNFFAFFPLAFVYLCIYSLIEKRGIPIRKLLTFLFLFLMVHLFHLLPLVHSFLFNPSDLFNRLATTEGGQFNTGLHYFMSVLPYIRLTNNFLAITPIEIIPAYLTPVWIVVPLVVMIGFLCFKKYCESKNERDYSYLLTFIFFLVLFFLVTAKVSYFGLELYKSFFTIPGFAMFRDNWGKFSYAYAFFYTILFGQSLFYLLIYIPKKYTAVLCSGILVFFVISAFPFIRGDLIRIPLDPKFPFETKPTLKMDPVYERVLEYIRKDPIDGRFFTVPFNEFFYPLVSGREGGMYQGPSMISYLTGRSDINGYSTLLPFTPTFLDLAKEKDYKTIENLFSILNIKYIFHNADESIYKYFPDFPYRSTREALPPDKESINIFLSHLSVTQKKSFNDKYFIYEVKDDIYLPHIYIATKKTFYDWNKYFKSGDEFVYTEGAFYKNSPDYDRRSVYIEESDRNKIILKEDDNNIPNIVITKVNPTRYLVQVKGAVDPYTLVLSETYSPLWKIYTWTKPVNEQTIASYFDGAISETNPLNKWLYKDTFAVWGKKSIADDKHMRANGYANAWVINPTDVGNKSDYMLVVDYLPQQIFYASMFISFSGIIIVIVWLSLFGFRSIKKST